MLKRHCAKFNETGAEKRDNEGDVCNMICTFRKYEHYFPTRLVSHPSIVEPWGSGGGGGASTL